MPQALFGRRRLLLMAMLGLSGSTASGRAHADPAAVAPVQQLCASLLTIMKASKTTPFEQRFSTLEPVIDRTFNLAAILQVSVGPSWAALPADQQAALQVAFRRYTIASYINSFDNYTGQRFDVLPDTKTLPNGEQLTQTRIVSASGDAHELDYVMRQYSGAWQVVDVLADGSISRVAVQRSDFRRLLTSGGAPALMASLEHKTADLSAGAVH